MKTIKTILAFLLLFFLSHSILAVEGYHKGDTIRYKFDNILIVVASTNALAVGNALEMDVKRIRLLEEILKELAIVPPAADERITISFNEFDKKLNVWNYKEVKLNRSKKNSKTIIVFDDGVTFEKDYGHYCIHFSYRDVETKIYMDDITDLSVLLEPGLKTKLVEAEEFLADKILYKNKTATNYRFSIDYWIDLRGDSINGYRQNRKKKLDQLILSIGIGSGWIKNTFVSDINFRVGFKLAYKDFYKNGYFIDYNVLYDFSESSDNEYFQLNHFLSLTWEHNFSNTPDKDKWYGFSFGYLVKQNGDFFKDNTFRMAINKKINNTFTVIPELYFNDFLKNVYPGIRLSVTF